MAKGKVVLYLGGGAMAGVFGAGVVTRLQDVDFYGQVDTIYASSAGVFNVAYFLARQTRLGSSIYYEDLIQGFIHPGRLIPGMFQRFRDRSLSLLKIGRECLMFVILII